MSVHVGDLVRIRHALRYWSEYGEPDPTRNVFEKGTLVDVTEMDGGFFLTNVPGTECYYWFATNGDTYTKISPLERLAMALGEKDEC